MLLRNQFLHAQFTFNFIDNLCENSIFSRLLTRVYVSSLFTSPFSRFFSRFANKQQFDLASPPLQHPKYYLQQQQHQHPLTTQQSLMVGSCQGNFQNPLTNLNTATLDRFPPPPSPSLFVSTSSTNPVCSSNEPVSIHEIYCYCFHIVGRFCLQFYVWNRFFMNCKLSKNRSSKLFISLLFLFSLFTLQLLWI